MVYNKTITFQILTTTKDKYGSPIDTWADVKTKKATIVPISGRDFFAAETVNSEITHKIFITHTSEIAPKMRIKYHERIFSIESIINVQERNIQTQLMCKELI